jgi:nicotinamidase/pyrazinamidase
MSFSWSARRAGPLLIFFEERSDQRSASSLAPHGYPLHVERNLPADVDEPAFATGKTALVLVDVQRDFLPGGKLAVREAHRIVPALNRYVRLAARHGAPIFLTRDWHPNAHVSFAERGGPWPQHCVAGTSGAEFADELEVPPGSVVVSKGTHPERDAYSGFEGTDLHEKLRALGITHIFVGGIATDYCVLNTVRDARAKGYDVTLLTDAMRAVEVNPGDEARALAEMKGRGAQIRELAR